MVLTFLPTLPRVVALITSRPAPGSLRLTMTLRPDTRTLWIVNPVCAVVVGVVGLVVVVEVVDWVVVVQLLTHACLFQSTAAMPPRPVPSVVPGFMMFWMLLGVVEESGP